MGAGPRRPRLTIGLPVYNGERYLTEALDALLAQTFTDYELIISDNASTDGTAAIAREYASRDPRVRYMRHPRNLGSAYNHNILVKEARGEYFKWAAHDDVYAPELLRRCIEALDSRPEMILAHSWEAFIDEEGAMSQRVDYTLQTDSASAPRRFRSVLYTQGGDDIYGVIRMEVMKRVAPHGSYHHADRTFVAKLALHGPFHQVPEVLYFRRNHPARGGLPTAGIRKRSANLDPRRANRWRHPAARLVVEYVISLFRAVLSAPISTADRLMSSLFLVVWLLGHVNPFQRRLEGLPPSDDWAGDLTPPGQSLRTSVTSSAGEVGQNMDSDGS